MADAQVLTWVDARIQRFRELIAAKPAGNVPINVNVSRLWRHRLLMAYARMIGNVESLATFGHITPEVAALLNDRIKGAAYRHIAQHLTGADL